MIKMFIAVGSLLISTLAVGASAGQLTFYSITRSVAAEVGTFENSEVVDRVGEMRTDSNQGDIALVAEADNLGASSNSSCEASWSSTSESIIANGIMNVGNGLATQGEQRYFHCWAGLIGEFSVTGASNYSFGGTASLDAPVSFQIRNFDSGESIDLVLPLGTGEFQYSGALPGPGTYQFSVWLDDLRSATDVFMISEYLEFGVTIVVDGTVATELSSWGGVKSLFR